MTDYCVTFETEHGAHVEIPCAAIEEAVEIANEAIDVGVTDEAVIK